MARDQHLSPDLVLPLPKGMPRLRIYQGRPIPWGTLWSGDRPIIGRADPEKYARAIQKADPLCWLCGGRFRSRLGTTEMFAFLIRADADPDTRVSTEPAAHRECLVWTVRQAGPALAGATIFLSTRFQVMDGQITMGPGIVEKPTHASPHRV